MPPKAGMSGFRQGSLRKAVTFAAEHYAAVACEVCLGQSFALSVRVRGDAANAPFPQVSKGLDQAAGFHDWHLEDSAHRAAHCAPEERAAARFTDD